MSNVTQTGAVGEVVVTQTGQEAAVTVVSSRGATGATGATGAAGPNTITTSTSSNLTGFIAANGTGVSGATAGATAATPSTIVLRDASAGSAFGPVSVTTLSASGTATLPHIHGSIAGNLYVHVRNTSGGTLTKGTPIYITGNVGTAGNEDRVTVAAADNTNPAKMPAVALLGSDLANNGDGNGIIVGELTNLNIPSYSINQELYVGAGAIATTKPTTGEVQSVGVVARINTNTGIIVVNMQGRRDAAITTSTSSDLIGFISANGVAVSGATVGAVDSAGNTIVLRDGFGSSQFAILEAYVGINTMNASADIQSRSTFKLFNGTYTTTLSHAPTANQAIAFPDKEGTVAMIDAETHTGAHAFSSTTRPTSAGTGTPEATSLITTADGDARYGAIGLSGTSAISITSQATPQTIRSAELAVGFYHVRMVFQIAGTVNTGTRHGYNFSGTATIRFFRSRTPTTTFTQVVANPFDLGLTESSTSAVIEGIIQVTVAGTLSMQAAQNTSHADSLSVGASNHMIITPCPNGSIS
jgi:hypothetical protein